MGDDPDLPIYSGDPVHLRIPVFNKLAIPFALIALVLIGAVRTSPGESEAARSYHDEVRAIVESIPIDFGDWMGESVALPTSATSLLNPNALVARRYVHRDKMISATLLIAQCRDARDMAGHFPPRCYPANGWLTREDEGEQSVRVEGNELAVYRYHRVAGRNERDITVYNLFALPTGSTSTSMKDVYRISADYQYRYFGAAQIQIVIDGSVAQEEHAWILDEMYAVVDASVERVMAAKNEVAPAEGSGS